MARSNRSDSPSLILEKKWVHLYRVLIRETIFPLALIIATVSFAVTLPYIVIYGNAHDLISTTQTNGLVNLVSRAWSAVRWKDGEVWSIIAVAASWATVSVLLPGEIYYGPVTLSGFRPSYKKSGFKFYIISMAFLIFCLWYFPVLHLYNKFVTFAGILSILGLVLSTLLFIKGHISPSPGVFGSSGNPLFDFYWGLELYPRFGPSNIFDLKTIVNCRFGLWLWQAVVLWAWKANYELQITNYSKGEINWPMTATAVLQTIYLAKFYYWEDGYMSTIDISVDKFGFYVGWGCVAWVPTFYTLTSVYLIKHSPVSMFGPIAFFITITIGILSIILNYEADRQRQVFRLTDGKSTIWGSKPKIIHAVYSTEDGSTKQSKLLASGLWGYARHLNYLFELTAAFSWSVPGLATSIVPYLYFIFLTILLVHRSIRDDDKCQLKYGRYWDKYCEMVKYRIVPKIY